MAYRRRQSAKKSSGFKIQTEKAVFLNFMNDIPNCLAIQTFPNMNQELIRETSEKVFTYCYSFREDSPFSRGLNYYCKEIGFCNSENQIIYKEFLPGVAKAYLMGEFNQFSKDATEMTEVQGEPGWFRTQFCASTISDGSSIALRVVDFQGTEYNMIPPSCVVTAKNKGVYLKYRKSPLPENPLRPQELLAYEIDVQQVTWEKLNQFLKANSKLLDKFNTITLRNVFNQKSGLLHRYTIERHNLEELEEAIEYIKVQLGAKVALEWSFQQTALHYSHGNPVQKSYTCSSGPNQCQFAFQNNDVLSYVLSIFSYFKNYFNVDGFFLNGIESIANSEEGVVLLKCINMLKDRLSEHGVVMATMKSKVPAVCEKLLNGGIGVMYAVNAEEGLDLNSQESGNIGGHQELLEKIQATRPYSNCLGVNLAGDFSNDNVKKLNVILSYLASEKGVFCSGKLEASNDLLIKVLKLRSQAEFFQESFKVLQVDSQKIFAQRGRSLIILNYSQEIIDVEYEGFEEAELIFNSGNDEPIREGNIIKVGSRSCVLFEKA